MENIFYLNRIDIAILKTLNFFDLNNDGIAEIILHLYADAMHGPHLLYI
jgi:hypothetical protein